MALKELPPSLVEEDCCTQFLKGALRRDGRGKDDFRAFSVEPLGEDSYLASLGGTKVSASVHSRPFKPKSGKQNRGDLTVNLSFIPSASKANMELTVQRLRQRYEDQLHNTLRAASIVDTRFLLIEQYEAAIELSVCVTVLNDAGGILDAAFVASLIALANYRLPKYKCEDGVFTKISTAEEWGQRVRIFSHAYIFTFGVFDGAFIADPDERECLYAKGVVRIGCTDNSMVFLIKEDGDGISLDKDTVMDLVNKSLMRAKYLEELLHVYLKDSKEL